MANSHIYPLARSLIHSLTHSPICSLTHPFAHSLTHSLTQREDLIVGLIPATEETAPDSSFGLYCQSPGMIKLSNVQDLRRVAQQHRDQPLHLLVRAILYRTLVECSRRLGRTISNDIYIYVYIYIYYFVYMLCIYTSRVPSYLNFVCHNDTRTLRSPVGTMLWTSQESGQL